MKTAKNTVNSRIILLINNLNLRQNDFCFKTGVSTGTLHNIKNGSEVQLRTLENISKGLNVSLKWLQTGDGEMFLPIEVKEDTNPWKDALVAELKAQVEFYKELINDYRSGKVNFLKLLKTTGADGKNQRVFKKQAA